MRRWAGAVLALGLVDNICAKTPGVEQLFRRTYPPASSCIPELIDKQLVFLISPHIKNSNWDFVDSVTVTLTHVFVHKLLVSLHNHSMENLTYCNITD